MNLNSLPAALLAVALPCLVCADTSKNLVLNYDIFADSQAIGKLTQLVFHNRQGHKSIEHSQIQVSGWWGKLEISDTLIEEFDGGNNLAASDSKFVDGNTVYWTRIQVAGNKLRGSSSKVKNTSSREKQALVSQAETVSGILTPDYVPDFGEIVAITDSLFTDRQLRSQDSIYTHQDFDTTESNLPFFVQAFGDKSLPGSLRLLDTQRLEISRVKLSDHGFDTLKIGGKNIRCRHLQISDSKSEPTQFWLYAEPPSIPFLVQYIGEDEDGPVEVRLNHYSN